MKLSAILLLLLPTLALAQLEAKKSSIGELSAQRTSAAGGASPDLLSENFEGTGYQQAGWTESGTIVDEDYTATALEGSQSLNISTVSASAYTYHAITSSTEVWGRVRFLIQTNSSAQLLAVNAGGSGRLAISKVTGQKLQVYIPAVSANTVAAYSTGTTYYLWFHYKAGSGANAIADVAFSTTTTRPTSGDNFASVSTGTSTDGLTRIYLGATATTTHDVILDEVLLSSTGYP